MSVPEVDSYREKFQSSHIARIYDDVVYDPASYESLIWEIEKRLLLGKVEEFRLTHPRIEYLDFATGSGRILSFLEDVVDQATGIEISASMVKRAQQRVKSARILCFDITEVDPEPMSRYDVITAFRFFANAEPNLRLSAMQAIVSKLRDHSSIIMFNNHRNALSYKGLLRPLDRVLAHDGSYKSSGNCLSPRQVQDLTDAVGLKIRQVQGYGLLSGKIRPLVSFTRQLEWEQWLSGTRLAAFGACQLYVCTRR
jgi:predicted TPR repeat methyltransferase